MIPPLRKSPASLEREQQLINCAQVWWCEAERLWTGRQQVRHLRVPDHEAGDAGWYGTATTGILRGSCRSNDEVRVFCTYLDDSKSSV